MSKSDLNSAIFMEDTSDDIKRKIKNAFCPEKILDKNPIIDYLKYIIFEKFDKLTIKREEKNGGDVTYNSF
jgi:tyrosyl-tRNA synthetase